MRIKIKIWHLQAPSRTAIHSSTLVVVVVVGDKVRPVNKRNNQQGGQATPVSKIERKSILEASHHVMYIIAIRYAAGAAVGEGGDLFEWHGQR